MLRERLWWAAGTIYRARFVIGLLTLLAVAAAVALTLQMPNRYRAETRLLLPQSAGMGSFLDSVIPGASELLGKKGGNYVRYLAILTSRTTMQQVVDRFNLVDVYDVADHRYPNEEALRRLGKDATFVVSPDFDYLSVQVLDDDPRRAAQMSTYFVEILNERHIAMNSSSAAEQRQFMERRLREAEVELDSVLAAQQDFQQRYGVVQLDAQATALMTALATAQAHVAEAEAEYQALAVLYGEENDQVTAARAALDAARQQVGRLSSGGESFMPVPLQRLPEVNRQYATLMVELKTQEEILRVVRPLYEQAVLQERQELDAVQVLDPAVPPQRKAEPARMVLVLVAALSALLLLMVLALVWGAVRDGGRGAWTRLRRAAA